MIEHRRRLRSSGSTAEDVVDRLRALRDSEAVSDSPLKALALGLLRWRKSKDAKLRLNRLRAGSY